MSSGKFTCGLIEGYYSEMRKRAPKELKDQLTQRSKKSWPNDPAYAAGYVKGTALAGDGIELPGPNRICTMYLGYRYEEE